MRRTAQRLNYTVSLRKSQHQTDFSVIFLTVSRNNPQKSIKRGRYFVTQAQIIEGSFSNSPRVRGFQLALPSRTFRNAAVRTNSAVGALARRAAYGFAVCGRRRLRRRPIPAAREAGSRAPRGSRGRRYAKCAMLPDLEKAAADADEGARRALREAKRLTSPFRRRPHKGAVFRKNSSFVSFGNYPRVRGFQPALPSHTFRNAAVRTNSAVGALARRAAYGFRRMRQAAAKPPPHAAPPLRGWSGAPRGSRERR